MPDWPTSFGSWYKIPKLVGGVKFEHTHRMIAQVAGLLTIILAVWTWRVEKRRWMRVLGFAALGTVIAQGILGGLTVLFLPASGSFVGACGAGANIFLHRGGDRVVHRPEMGGRAAAGGVRPAAPQPVHADFAVDFRVVRAVDSGRDVPPPRFELVAARACTPSLCRSCWRGRRCGR